MIKLKNLLKETTWNNRKFGEPLPTMADYKKAHESKKEAKLTEGKADQSFNKIIALLRKESRRLNDDDSYELSTKLKAWFNKNIL